MSNKKEIDLQEVKVHPFQPTKRGSRALGVDALGSAPLGTKPTRAAPLLSAYTSISSAGDIAIPAGLMAPALSMSMAYVSPFAPAVDDHLARKSQEYYTSPFAPAAASTSYGRNSLSNETSPGMTTPFSHGTSILPGGLHTMYEDEAEDGDQDIGRMVNEYLEEEKAEEERKEKLESEKRKLLLGSRFGVLLDWLKGFTKGALHIAWTVVFLFSGITMKLETDNRQWLFMPAWRICILLGCLPSIIYVPSHIMFVLIFLLENQLVSHNGGVLLYYLMSIRKHAVSLMRCVLGLVIFHYFVAADMSGAVSNWEVLFSKAWSCLSLVFLGNLLKALMTRALSRHFHTKAYFERMQDAVQNEYYAMALLKPRGNQLLPALLGAQALGKITEMWHGHRDPTVHQSISLRGGALKGHQAPPTHTGISQLARADRLLLDALDMPTDPLAKLASMDLTGRRGPGSSGGGGPPVAPSTGSAGVTPERSRSMVRSSDQVLFKKKAGGGPSAGISLTSPVSRRASIALAAAVSLDRRTSNAHKRLSDTGAQKPDGMPGVSSFSFWGGSDQDSDGDPSVRGGTAYPTARPMDRPRHPGDNINPMQEDVPLLRDPKDSTGGARPHFRPASPNPSRTYSKQFVHSKQSGSGVWRAFGNAISSGAERVGNFFHGLQNDYQATVLMHSYAKSKENVVTVVGPEGARLAFAKDVAAAEAGDRQAARQAVLGTAPSMINTNSVQWDNQSAVSMAASETTKEGKGPNAKEMSLYFLEKHIRNNKLKYVTLTDQLVQAAEASDNQSSEINSSVEAKRLAFSIYWNVLNQNMTRSYLVIDDLQGFFDTPEDAKACFELLDRDGNGQVSLSEIVEVVVKIYKERKNLALSLRDTKSVVAKLELVCGVIIHAVLALAYLWIFNVNIGNLWVSISTFCLAFVFVFGNSLRTLYESVLFLFVIHPFDVGDWLELSNGLVCKVESIDLMAITAHKSNGRKLYLPINRLMTDIVMNYSRSYNYWETCTMLVDLDTPNSVLKHVETKMKEFAAKNPKELVPNADSIAVGARTVEDAKKLKWMAYWELPHVAEDVGRTFEWRDKMMLTVKDALNECGVAFTQAPEAPFELPNGMRPCDLPENEPVDILQGHYAGQYMFARTGVLLRQEQERGGQQGSGSNSLDTASAPPLSRARGFSSFHSRQPI